MSETPATEVADTPDPTDSPNEPSNPPDGTSTESGAVQSRGTDPEPSSDEKIDQAYDPSQPPYSGEEQSKGRKRKESDEPEAEPGGLPEQTPPT